MPAITITDLSNAKLDVDHIAAIATSAAPTATDRLGNVKSTVSAVVNSIKAFNSRGAWIAATAYAIKDLVSSSGTWYVCVTAHASSAAFATDSATKWRVHQGLTADDLAASTAAGLVGYGDDTVAEVLDTIRSDPLNLFPATYAEPSSRLIVGQEYLWAFQQLYRVFSGEFAETHKILWSGDSTTAGDGAEGFSPAVVSQHWAVRYGLINIENINVGQSGYSASHWVAPGGFLDQDLAAYPNLRCYVLRWGINDAANGIAALEENMRNGLTRIRAAKGVKQLSIILMSPNVVSHDPSGRNETWNEAVSKLYKVLAREFQCCFIDTYALWRDARHGVGAWLDDPYVDGLSGVHPNATMNHVIVDTVAEVLYRPISVGPSVRNLFTNTSSGGGTVTAATLSSNAKFHHGISIYRTDAPTTFPFSGSVITTKTADSLVKQELIGYEDNITKRSIVRYAIGNEAWSEWRGLMINPAFLNDWTNYSSGDILSYQKSTDGTVFIEGRVKNASGALSVIFTLPVGFRPIANFRVICHNYDTSVLGNIQIQVNGSVVFVNGGTSAGNDVNFRCFFKAVF